MIYGDEPLAERVPLQQAKRTQLEPFGHMRNFLADFSGDGFDGSVQPEQLTADLARGGVVHGAHNAGRLDILQLLQRQEAPMARNNLEELAARTDQRAIAEALRR